MSGETAWTMASGCGDRFPLDYFSMKYSYRCDCVIDSAFTVLDSL